jgi:preprotein translocase subunit SecD
VTIAFGERSKTEQMITAATGRTRKAILRPSLAWFAFLVIPAWFLGTAAAETVVIEIVRAEMGFDQRTGQPVVSFTMTEASSQVFAELTRQNIGRPLEVRVDGRLVMKPVIREPILAGKGQLSGGLSVEQAKDLAARLSDGTAKMEIEAAPN